ncbi:MAG: phosphatidate cytidylyltransferase, partial [Bacteroidales bacterium]|nr:phosphatidate cytidylyltransferase [Bacteroidales bacterium]
MKELIKRTAYGFLFVVLVVGSILVSKYAFAVLMLFVSLVGSHEMLNLQLQHKLKPSLTWAVLLANLLFYTILCLVALDLIAVKFLALALLPILLPFLHALFSTGHTFPEISAAYWPSLFLVSLPASLLIFMYNNSFFGDLAGAQLIVSILFMVWINDVFAYLVGISIG